MKKSLKDLLSLIDFVTTIIAIVVVIMRIYLLKWKFIKQFHNAVDFIMIICFVADVVFCVSSGYSVVYIKKGGAAVLRGVKLIRMLKILYVSESLFKYERNIVNLFF